jgi:mevalonate pyrophosphate decarboxylase
MIKTTKKQETVQIEYKKEGRAFQFWLNGKLKETDNNIHKLMQKVKKYKLDWIEEKK